MNKVLKRMLLVILILSFTVLIPTFMESTGLFGTNANAEDAGWSEVTLEGDPESVPSGTAKDPFIVLEIVPNKAMGEISYLVGGEEPVDDEMFNKDHATGDLWFLGGAITPYKSYVEKPIANPAARDEGWIPETAYTTKSGYFKYVGTDHMGEYKVETGQDVFTRVSDGSGEYKAVLESENTNIYNESWNQINNKNVNAYFVYGKPDGVALYHTSYGYEPCSVTRVADNKGDYDYNSEKKAFILNRGKGEYAVLFARSYSGSNLYYMTADYTIVDDFSGEYSWSINYVEALGGNYKKKSGGIKISKSNGDHYNYTYVWVDAKEEALSKPSDVYVENGGTSEEKIWAKNQVIDYCYEYNFNITLVNNEWFKRLVLRIAAEDCKNYKVKVYTMTPEELNLPANQSLLNRANMFYINDNYKHNLSYIDLYQMKNKTEAEYLKNHPDQEFNKLTGSCNFAVNDLNWSSVMKIFYRTVGVKSAGTSSEGLGGYRAAIVFDDTFYQSAINGTNGYGNPYNRNVTAGFNYNGTSATVCNMAKLYIMLYQRDPVNFYKLFVSPAATHKITEYTSTDYNYNITKTTGAFVRPDSTTAAGTEAAAVEYTFWNGNTFCPYMFDDSGNVITPDISTEVGMELIKKNIPNFNITAQTTDMNSNVLVLNGRDIFTSKFIEPMYSRPEDSMPEDAVKEAQLYIASQNGGVIPSVINIFQYIQVISNSGTGYGNNSSSSSGSSGENGTSGSNLRTYTSILNIEPTADFTVSESNIRTMLTGYNLKITNMTSEEFNSSILDINTHYDLIYIGSAGGRFNKSSGSTVFNKGADETNSADRLDGSVYNKGDRIITSQGTRNYIDNDITAQKIEELKDFLAAGYPIVFEDNVYKLSVVKSDTNLYGFIQTAKGTAPPRNVLNYADYENINQRYTFRVNMTASLNIIRPMIRIIEPTLPDNASENYLYVNSATNILNIEFAIVPKGLTEDRSIRYNAYLYMDYNEDGIFSESEKLNYKSDDTSLSPLGICENKFKAYLYSYDMSKYNGVYQWQVKVVRQSYDTDGTSHDTRIRSEITGYAACTNRQTIDILQITDNPDMDPTAYSIEKAVTQSTDTSLIKKYGGFGSEKLYTGAVDGKLKDYDLNFTTMSVKEFLNLYEAEPYDMTSANTIAATDKLSDYHLLILDNQKDSITDAGALLNIKTEITNGMGVIFTKGAVNYNNQDSYLDTKLFVSQKTYPRLSHIATPTTEDPYYIFDFITSGFDMKSDTPYHADYITKSNEGADSQYPYKIGDAINIADNFYDEDAAIDYNRGDSTPLIGWYCLSDSRSPVVRSAVASADTEGGIYSGIYSSSPNDTKNNYYLFNKGKIYYSGVQLNKADTTGNDGEIKLFINTIIATYKTSGRIVAKTPIINIIDPVPVKSTIILSKSDVEGKDKFPVTFTLTNSSSLMDLSLSWNLIDEDWCKVIYKKTDSGWVRVKDMANTGNGTYRIDIPVTEISGNHPLSITAKNKENKTETLNTIIKYSPDPVTVTIDNSDLIKNVDKDEQYLYIDIDYSEVNNEADDLNAATDLKLEFTVSKIPGTEKVSVAFTDTAGNPINVKDDRIYNAATNQADYTVNDQSVPNGSYYVKIPASVMNGISSKDITIAAKLSDSNKGSTTVKLIRRSLFDLD